uniref:SET domain-containing protein n=1 Tax=Micromonas pusilla TaxID=38833 RepID=A0A7S0KUA5_MICPS
MSATDADAVHAILPGGSVELRVADPADGGRRLFVRAPIKAGDEILSLNPYAAVLNDASRTSRCDHTFAKPSDNGGSLLRCARSKVARYVSRDAQVAAWKRGYKEECASLVNCAPRVPPATVRLAARILWRRAREAAAAAAGSNDNAADDDEMIEDGVAAAAAVGLGRGYDAVDALGDHWERLSDSRKASLAHAATLAAAFHAGTLGRDGPAPPNPENPNPDPNPYDVARLLAKVSCNAHTVCDEELNAVGVAVYPVAAMVNHGDAPTAAQSFKGKRIVLRATRDLKPGDEVTMAYVELLATRQERRAALFAGYAFDIDATSMTTYCPHARPDLSNPIERAMRSTRRTRLPGGAVLVDHGEGSDSPPWRTGHADPYLCAVEASRKSGGGILHGGVEVVTRPAGTGMSGDGDDGDDDDDGASGRAGKPPRRDRRIRPGAPKPPEGRRARESPEPRGGKPRLGKSSVGRARRRDSRDDDDDDDDLKLPTPSRGAASR